MRVLKTLLAVVGAVLTTVLMSAAPARGAECVLPTGVDRAELVPFGIEPVRDRVIAPSDTVNVHADLPIPVYVEGGEIGAVGIEVTITRRGRTVFRRAGSQTVALTWAPPKPGRYQFLFASLLQDEGGLICTVTTDRQVDVFRRVVSPLVLLRRVKSMAIRMQKGAQSFDFRAVANTLDNRLTQLSGLRLRSRVGTAALDRWIVASRRFQRFIERLADRFDAGTLDEGDVRQTDIEVARWLAATSRFLAVVQRIAISPATRSATSTGGAP